MGRKPKSGVKSETNPHREGFTDIRAKLLHGHREWKMIRLRELVSDHQKQFASLADNHLSARAAANAEIARRKRYVELDEIDALWRDTVAGFERAVLDGDADWFERQAKATAPATLALIPIRRAVGLKRRSRGNWKWHFGVLAPSSATAMTHAANFQ